MTKTSLSPSKEGISNLKHEKFEEKGVSEPPASEVTNRFFTLKTFLMTTTKDWEEYWEHTTEPR